MKLTWDSFFEGICPKFAKKVALKFQYFSTFSKDFLQKGTLRLIVRETDFSNLVFCRPYVGPVNVKKANPITSGASL